MGSQVGPASGEELREEPVASESGGGPGGPVGVQELAEGKKRPSEQESVDRTCWLLHLHSWPWRLKQGHGCRVGSPSSSHRLPSGQPNLQLHAEVGKHSSSSLVNKLQGPGE